MHTPCPGLCSLVDLVFVFLPVRVGGEQLRARDRLALGILEAGCGGLPQDRGRVAQLRGLQ